jgi:hypothetical protein
MGTLWSAPLWVLAICIALGIITILIYAVVGVLRAVRSLLAEVFGILRISNAIRDEWRRFRAR